MQTHYLVKHRPHRQYFIGYLRNFKGNVYLMHFLPSLLVLINVTPLLKPVE